MHFQDYDTKHDAKYDAKKKSGSKEGKPKNPNATSNASPSTLHKGSSGSYPVHFRCKKNHTKGH